MFFVRHARHSPALRSSSALSRHQHNVIRRRDVFSTSGKAGTAVRSRIGTACGTAAASASDSDGRLITAASFLAICAVGATSLLDDTTTDTSWSRTDTRVSCDAAAAAQTSTPWPTDPSSTGGGSQRDKPIHDARTKKLLDRSRPRNVMIHRMRSVRARDMNEKYDINWDVVLGEGAYGSVHPARLAVTGEKVALKKITKRYTKMSAFKAETDALLRLYDNGGHPNISGLRDMYEDYNHFYLILDLVSGGEMFEHLVNYGAYSEADAARLVLELTSALAFMHGVGVVHADLKPENLLLCSKKVADGTIKIIDFGCAVVSQDNYHDNDDHDDHVEVDGGSMRLWKPAAAAKAPKVDTSTGTTAYWPPERFIKGSQATPAMDIWSAGVILYIMLTGVHPFDPEGMSTDEEIEERIKTNPTPPIGPPYTSHLSPSAIDLIKKLMHKDPSKRLTANEMIRHPWVRGETANTFKIVGSDKKLSRFMELRQKLEAGIFAVLVNNSNQDESLNDTKMGLAKSKVEVPGISERHIMKRAFEVFDAEGKGFVSSDDLGRVVSEATGEVLSSSDRRDLLEATLEAQREPSAGSGISLATFSEIFSSLKHEHYPKGRMIFSAGEEGDAMYFINSGKVEILTRKGQLVSLLRHGDFFGESSLLEKQNRRFAGARASTPVDVIKISKRDFERYISSSDQAKQSLKLKSRARSLADAKNLIRLQTNVKVRLVKKGEVIYKEGDEGESMFLVDDNEGGELGVLHDGVKVHSYQRGDTFGESSLLFKRPRSSTVVCTTDTCMVHEMRADDFLSSIAASPRLAKSLRDMCRKRLFKKAVKKFSMDRKRGFEQEDLEAAFHAADKDNSGGLDKDEIRDLFHKMDPSFPDEEILALVEFLDIDEDGQINLEEFKRIFRVFESGK